MLENRAAVQRMLVVVTNVTVMNHRAILRHIII